MHTKAVYHAARGLENAGLAVLRFNFRGVGRSAGSYDSGIGERDDARAALAWLAQRWPDEPLFMGGFSFGSWVGLDVGGESPLPMALIGIGLPIVLYDFEFLQRDRRPLLLVSGSRDMFCPVDALQELAAQLGPRCQAVVLEGAEHLLTTHLPQLEAAVQRFATDRLESASGA
jgi:alpha/beta superfamily hydrolase